MLSRGQANPLAVWDKGGDVAEQESMEFEQEGHPILSEAKASPAPHLHSEHKWRGEQPTEEEALMILGYSNNSRIPSKSQT